LVPWKEGKPLNWDSTVVCTVADSYVSGSAREAGTAAKTSFLAELGHRITALSGDSREISFLFQRVSVFVQRFNSVLLRESFTSDSRPDDNP